MGVVGLVGVHESCTNLAESCGLVGVHESSTIFHQQERRVKAHVMVAFLGYALWVTLKHTLRRRYAELKPAKAIAELATIQSADIILPTTDGREIRLRRITTPTLDQKKLLQRIGLALPDRLSLIRECSGDLEIR